MKTMPTIQMKSSAGVSLIEVLITMFVMAVALLGSAQLQAYSLKVNQGSQFRAQAVILGTDILERIESNNPAAIKGTYAATVSAAGSAPTCDASPCTSGDMAAYDLHEFGKAIDRQLPEGWTAKVTFAGAGPFNYTVQITWSERMAKQKGATTTSTDGTETFSYTVTRSYYDKASTL